jgi:Tfp pilus assembly protein PilN
VIGQLNLASQPFRNRALPWTVATVVAFASVLALVFIVGWGREAQARAARAEQDVQELRRQETDLRAKAQQVKDTLRPEQRMVLDAAHEIVDRKNFSWSRLLADLEATVPASVRVARISVRDTRQTGGQTQANLELTVVGKTPNDITRLIGELARTGVFSADLLSQSPRAAKGEPGTEATLRVYYTPRAGAPPLKPQTDATPTGVAVNNAQRAARAASETQ